MDMPRDQAPSRYERDIRMVKSVRDGCPDAWREFVEQYSGIIYRALLQQLFVEDKEEVRDVFVDLLGDLYATKLASYEGRASLGGWLAVTARRAALDWLRKHRGRRRLPSGYKKLSEFEKKVLQIHHIEGCSYSALIHHLNWNGHTVTVAEIALAIIRIEKVIGKRYLRKLEYEAHARQSGVPTGRMLEYIVQKRHEYSLNESSSAPDFPLMQEETEAMVARLKHLRDGLSPDEQLLLRLRFDNGWTAQRIARHLGLGGQRRVYTLISAVVRKLRSGMGDAGVAPKRPDN